MEMEQPKPAWARDMRYCRLLALRVIQDIRHAMDRPGGEEEKQAKAMIGESESLADGLVKMGTFLMKWHAFERGLEIDFTDWPDDGRQLEPHDAGIMGDYAARVKAGGK